MVLYYLIFVGLLAYLIIAPLYQFYITFDKRRVIKHLKHQLQHAIYAEESSKKYVLNLVDQFYGTDKASKIQEGGLWYRMPVDLLYVSMGMEEASRNQVLHNNVYKYLYFNGFVNRLGNTKYRFEVRTLNGFVIGWKDLA